MKKNNKPLIAWLLGMAAAVILCQPGMVARAGLLQVQSSPGKVGSLYWGSPASWDALNAPHYQLDTAGDGTQNRDINYISILHDDYYFYVRVNFNQAPAFNGQDFYLWLDTDLNPATGTRNFSGTGSIGSEYVVSGAAFMHDPTAWNFVSWVNWDQSPGTAGDLARDVIFSINRSSQLTNVSSFYFTYQLQNGGVVGDWYPDSANALDGDYFEYTTAPVFTPSPAASSSQYATLIAQAAPLAYYRLNETNVVTTDVATNSGWSGANGNGAYTVGNIHPVTGAIAGDPDTAARFTAVNADSEDGAVPVIVPWPEKPFIRELWDGVTAGNLDGAGDGSSSAGFASGSTWHVNVGTIMKINPALDVSTPPGPPCQVSHPGTLYADTSNPGSLPDIWDPSAWATRPLAPNTQINFGAAGDYWITLRVDNGGDTAMGVGLADAGDGSGHVIGVGALWNTAGTAGSANNALYITDGNLGTDSPYHIVANSAAGTIDGPGLIVAHLVTTSSGAGTIQATVYKLGDNIPTDPANITWQTSYSFNTTMTATHLVAWLNGDTSGGNGLLDGIRVATSFQAMFMGEMNTAGSFTLEAWLRPTVDGAGNAQSPFQNKDVNDTSPNRVGWDVFQRDSGSGYNFRMFNGNAHDRVFNLTGGAYTVGEWGHLVAVYDAAASSATLYFNGVQVAQSTSPNGTYLPNGSFPLSIGSYSDARQNPFIGDIDEVALYTNALSAAQVLAHYQNAKNPSRSVAYSSLVKADGAVEYLRLGEPAKNVAANSGTLGTAANGAYNLFTTAGYSGPFAPAEAGFEATNKAAFFNGATSFIDLGNPAALNFSGQITLEAWVQPGLSPASSGGFGYIIGHGYDEAYNETALRVQTSSGSPEYAVATYVDGTTGQGVSAPIPAADRGNGAWVHLVGTYDGVNWNLYRNGVLLASAPDTSGTGAVPVNYGNWAVGARGRWSHMDVLTPVLDRQFQGAIDEPAIYDRALSAEEVMAHYLAGAPSGLALTIAPSGSNVVLTWTAGTLQAADDVNGTYTDVVGAVSPYTVDTTSSAKKFYRLKL